MVVLPALYPVTTPVVETEPVIVIIVPGAAIEVFALLHTPPEVEQESVIELALATDDGPEIFAGNPLTVTALTLLHPFDKV